jgi:C4-dicarboxylate transporter DctQ subunit
MNLDSRMLIFDRLEEALMGFFLGAMTVLTFTQVVLRSVFNTGWVWSLEATVYCFAWLVLIGASQGVRERSHIAVEMAVMRLTSRSRRIAGIAALLICIGYGLMMLYGSLVFLSGLYDVGHHARDIPIPRWLLAIILPVGFALLLFRFTQLGWGILTGRETTLGFGRDYS